MSPSVVVQTSCLHIGNVLCLTQIYYPVNTPLCKGDVSDIWCVALVALCYAMPFNTLPACSLHAANVGFRTVSGIATVLRLWTPLCGVYIPDQ